jgi:arsenical pump membrane protein
MHAAFTWAIVLASLGCIILRPFGVREAVPAMAGAVLLVLCGLLPPGLALRAAGQGADVYLFLIGMMVLSELAAGQGVFAWGAGCMARAAGGSALRLFCLIYAMAVVVTVFLSNDATAVVLTPAVAAMAGAVRAERKLPFLLICAFVANAASFVLPISNPANLVVFAGAMPDLTHWLRGFGPASVAAISATFLLLWFTQRVALRQSLVVPEEAEALSAGGKLTLAGLGGMAGLLLLASAQGWRLGLPTFCAGLGTAALVLIPARQSPWGLARQISWSVLPLVAGLFVMVGALDHIGLAAALGARLGGFGGMWGVGLELAVLSNLVNNLPSGLLAGHVLAQAVPGMRGAALLGVDLGPNLSISGSLATLLWLAALRRNGLEITAWRFLRLGAVVMPPALLAALAALWLAS